MCEHARTMTRGRIVMVVAVLTACGTSDADAPDLASSTTGSAGAGGTGGGAGPGGAGGDVVTTSFGPVRGAIDGATRAFKGIPYAAPPVGALRWRAPEPPEPW